MTVNIGVAEKKLTCEGVVLMTFDQKQCVLLAVKITELGMVRRLRLYRARDYWDRKN